MALLLAPAACSSSAEPVKELDQKLAVTVVATYADNVHRAYESALDKTKLLQAAVNKFVAAPTADGLEACKKAWIDARTVYELTEPYRFYNGPIDNEETGPEGRINSWPLDENYVDYVEGNSDAGIINDPKTFPTISKELIRDLNEKGGEKNLSSGYHAIEFLLWGQDLNKPGFENKPGQRPFTDYLATGGTAKNQVRRGEYLKAVTALLVDDLTTVEVAWEPGKTNYSTTFRASDPRQALQKILSGMGSLAAGELSRERMNNAYATKDQEEEHSCFSDTTVPIDILQAVRGIENVYLGRLDTFDGPGLDDLVKPLNADLDARMKKQLSDTIAAVSAIPAPFDRAILGDDASDGRKKLKLAIDSTKKLGELTAEIATLFQVKINLE